VLERERQKNGESKMKNGFELKWLVVVVRQKMVENSRKVEHNIFLCPAPTTIHQLKSNPPF
jgi:hypothetical protein